MLDRQPRHAQPEWCPATQGQTPSQRGGSILAIAAEGSTFRQENTAYAGSSRLETALPHPHRHFGGSPFHQQTAIRPATSDANPAQNQYGWRSAGTSTQRAMSRTRYTASTTQPSHVLGGPQPQP
jgi:hypothetical protein